MKFLVNENCIGCGLCSATCPEVFRMEDGHAVAIEGDVPAAAETGAREAKENCPTHAIEEA